MVFGCCGFVSKGITVIFGMSMQLVIVQTMVRYFHNDYSYLVSTHAQMVFLKKRKRQSVALIIKTSNWYMDAIKYALS